MDEFLQASPIIDFHHPTVAGFARDRANGIRSVRDKAVHLYYAVRDGIRYDPFSVVITEEGLRASSTLAAGRGWCVAKAILFAACCRANGIPARLGFADIRNHMSSPRLRELMRTDIFYWHGYASIHIDGAWIKATPAFNIELCHKQGYRPVDFDGRHHAPFHPRDLQGHAHMEYLQDRGEFAEVPLAPMLQSLTEKYGI